MRSKEQHYLTEHWQDKEEAAADEGDEHGLHHAHRLGLPFEESAPPAREPDIQSVEEGAEQSADDSEQDEERKFPDCVCTQQLLSDVEFRRQGMVLALTWGAFDRAKRDQARVVDPL